MQRFERAPFDTEGFENRLEVVGSMQSEPVVREKTHGLGCRGQRVGHGARVGKRMQPRDPGGTRRSQREAANRLDNPIEFEGPQGACMHRALIRSE
jgi:hypothetical protein